MQTAASHTGCVVKARTNQGMVLTQRQSQIILNVGVMQTAQTGWYSTEIASALLPATFRCHEKAVSMQQCKRACLSPGMPHLKWGLVHKNSFGNALGPKKFNVRPNRGSTHAGPNQCCILYVQEQFQKIMSFCVTCVRHIFCRVYWNFSCVLGCWLLMTPTQSMVQVSRALLLHCRL